MIGIGIDLCEIARMQRLLEKDDTFLRRYFTGTEQDYIKARGNTAAQSMAAMFAAKEALLKAMGIGIGSGVPLSDIEIHHTERGQPVYRLHAAAADQMAELGATRALLSLTHEAGVAAAVAVLA